MERSGEMRGLLAGVLVVAAIVVGGASAQAPSDKLLDTLVVPFADEEPVESKITLLRGVAYTVVISGTGQQTSSHGTVECDVMYCLTVDSRQPFARGILGFKKEQFATYKRLSTFAGKSESEIPYNASHTYTVKMATDLDLSGRLVVRSEFAAYRGCAAPITCSGSFTVKIYGPAQEEREEDDTTFAFRASALHPAKIRNPFAKFEKWFTFALSTSTKRLTVRYAEPEWPASQVGRSIWTAFAVGKTQLRRSGPAAVLKVPVTVTESVLEPKGVAEGLPTCPKGTKGTIVLIDDSRLVAGGEQKRGQTRDEVHISVPACPYLSHRITNADSLHHDPFVGGRKGSPQGGQWADVTIGANAAPEPDMTGKAVQTAAAALAMVEKWIRHAADECEITGWQIKVSGLPGLWKITATVTMGGRAQSALFNIAGNKLAARNAIATEILNNCR